MEYFNFTSTGPTCPLSGIWAPLSFHLVLLNFRRSFQTRFFFKLVISTLQYAGATVYVNLSILCADYRHQPWKIRKSKNPRKHVDSTFFPLKPAIVPLLPSTSHVSSSIASAWSSEDNSSAASTFANADENPSSTGSSRAKQILGTTCKILSYCSLKFSRPLNNVASMPIVRAVSCIYIYI